MLPRKDRPSRKEIRDFDDRMQRSHAPVLPDRFESIDEIYLQLDKTSPSGDFGWSDLKTVAGPGVGYSEEALNQVGQKRE